MKERIMQFLLCENGQSMIRTGTMLGFVAMTIVIALFVVNGGSPADVSVIL